MKHFAAIFVAILAINNSHGLDINICDGVADGIFLADLEDCSKYYTCYYNTYYGPFSCPTGYNFDAPTQTCDFPDNVQCFECNSSLTTFPYDKTCSKYIMCYDSVPLVRECIPPLQYNSDTDRCDFPNVVNCYANMCPPNDINNIVFLPSNSNCSEYFICYNGVPKLHDCAKGLLYNPDKQACDYAANVNCTVSATSRQVLSYSKQPPVRANIECPQEGGHFYPNEEDPASYFFCMNGSGVKLTCTPGLEYDHETESCRIPSDLRK